MERITVRLLVVDMCEVMQRAIASVTWLPGLDDVIVEHILTGTQADGLRAFGAKPHAAIIDPVLGSDLYDRRGMAVVWAAHARGIPVIVHTSQRLEDPLQRDLADAKIPLLIKSVDSIILNDIAVRRALNRDESVDAPFDMLVRIGRLLRALPGRISHNVAQATALALVDAISDAAGNKTKGAQSLGENRHYADRALAWLPKRPLSHTRLAVAARSGEPNSSAPKGAKGT
jgi:hypothetical protein